MTSLPSFKTAFQLIFTGFSCVFHQVRPAGFYWWLDEEWNATLVGAIKRRGRHEGRKKTARADGFIGFYRIFL